MKETLQDLIKRKEKESEYIIPEDKHIIIRIDGHKFSKFTKGLNKPFDEVFSRAMILSTKDLVDRFQAYTGYTQSDEITLFIPSLLLLDDLKNFTHIFGGRTQKIASLVSSFATVRFNYWFKKIAIEMSAIYVDIDINKYSTKFDRAYFDARAFGVEDEKMVFNSFLFRTKDCLRNSKQQFARTYCSHKELLGKKAEEQIEFCKEKTGYDWNTLPDHLKYGIFIKRALYKKQMDSCVVHRSKFVYEPKKICCFSEENLEFIMSKYLKDESDIFE